MKFLKSFFAVTFPLIVMLGVFSIYLIVNKVVDNYKQNITDDYAIVVITNTPLSQIDELAGIKVRDIEPINRDKIIKSVQDNLSDTSVDLLKRKLPYFYEIHLEQFPTTRKLEMIRKELITVSNIRKIETFTNDHNKIYSLFILVQDIVLILFAVVLMFSILLLSTQIKIWFFEQSDRISIIQLHGGSLLYSSKPILKVIIASSVFSSIFVNGMLYLIMTNISYFVQPELVAFIPKAMGLEVEMSQIIALSFFIPLITFFGLLIRHKTKN
jgi:cell division transport system permease protein